MEANKYKIKEILPFLKDLVKYKETKPEFVDINEFYLN